jgi:murein DD-endopeptidase MepM/ murein hydrolase activator NlpD
MDQKKRSGFPAGAMEGKGFYLVLFLCAAVVGASAWLLLSGVRSDVDEIETAERTVDVSDAQVTMVPAGNFQEPWEAEPAEPAGEPEVEEEDWEASAYEEEDVEVFSGGAGYVWPVRGGIEVPYAVETLRYDATMADWRTHDGIDIACAMGDQVIAAAAGTVTGVWDDPLYGTTVEIDHENGVHTVYANLAAEPPVWEGDTVTMGQVIGSVGGTALAETNEVPHLHLTATRDGERIDPMELLPSGDMEE